MACPSAARIGLFVISAYGVQKDASVHQLKNRLSLAKRLFEGADWSRCPARQLDLPQAWANVSCSHW
jgi:hypothetical protein